VKLRLERRLPCDPEVAFSLATDPAHMNRWSTAKVRSTRLGDGHHPAGVGAMREVTLPGRGGRVLEEVVEASEPPRRFAYRVVRGAPVRSHLGVMTFSPTAAGTRFTWEVDVDAPWPALEVILRRTLLPELEVSVAALVRISRAEPPGSLPPLRRLDETDALPGLYAAADTVRSAQRALADELEAAGDARHWFTRVYQHVTEEQIAACREGRFDHPAWVLRLVPGFHHYYAFNFERLVGRAAGPVEEHWRRAFAATVRPDRWKRGRFEGMGWAVFQGMRAHIEEDLPRALAETFAASYRGRCDYARFRADYLRMGSVFQRAGDRLVDKLGFFEVPMRVHLLGAVLPREVLDAWSAKRFYDIARKRREAFERGERLAAMLDGVAA
jgi:uncharacterized protein YndB with AHSA1/START domain